ncbi:sialate O-acetylesterase [Aquiflexum sp. TKW24L]|uniref:sialate O-acetylesterase n=1 Tax=Aquiflexum sp. TKW24L TaxID=2942212 RepID=UPI0020BDC5F1|nr:sialate O-acetylesterase [Aquiflexum sp. TKW24L]MCL6258255.1 sialate O-acetylesterase [Aquiflexum sp. TKW24L]
MNNGSINIILNLVLIFILSNGGSLFAQTVEFNAIFSDGMVLQQNSKVSIFGFSKPNQALVLKASWFVGELSGQSDDKGKFVFELETPNAGGPYKIQVNDNNIEDVLIGEVWLGSGQSNMQMRLNEIDVSIKDLDKLPEIRFFTVPVQDSKFPLDRLNGGKWISGADQGNIRTVSAVSYYYALTLHQNLNVPIGVISASRGASGAEEWIQKESYNALPENVRTLYTPEPAKYPSSWYNGMIHPLIPYNIKGVIWYQGENNVARMTSYPLLIKTLVEGWSRDFEQEDMPFYMVQLPSFKREWQEFRLIQESIADSMPQVGLITTIDLGEENDIHPKRKTEVGQRLAYLALAKTYKKEFRFSSPRVDQVIIKDDKVLITFHFAESGLMTSGNEDPKYFEIAGIDGVFYPAKAKLEGSTIEAKADEVTNPVSVRYFWMGYGKPNLFSIDGYPVAPFNHKKYEEK